MSVVLSGERLTVAATPMTSKPPLDHVETLLSYVSGELKLKVKLLLMDRGYFSAEMIRYLDSHGVRYIVQAPACLGGLKEEGGEDRPYTTTGHKRRKGEQVTFRLVTLKERRGKEDALLVFATNASDLKPQEVRETFRKRWGIETSYRVIRMFLAKTTSKLHNVRVLYFQIAITLYNLWVLLNYKQKRRGICVRTLKLHITLPLVLLPTLTENEAENS